MNARTITQSALCAALIVVCSWISVPMVIPATLQTLGVFFTLFLLGGKRSFVVFLVYIALGAAGLPVFSGFGSGLGVLFGPTGGFLIGFLIMSIFVWGRDNSRIWVFVAMIICYAFGTVWFMVQSGASFVTAFSLCVLPFILPDLVKLILADILAKKIKKFIKNS